MSKLPMRALLVAAVAVYGAGGCALFSKGAPSTVRYFTPERPDDVPRAASPRPAPRAELRLGRLSSAANLRENFIRRESASQVDYDRVRRWTEAPEQYFRRRLARVLFEERGLREVVGGGGPTLEVTLTAFEEVRAQPPVARVQVIVRLQDERLVRWEETVTVEQPVVVTQGGDPADAAVEAIGGALRAVVDRIADRVVLELTVAPTARVGQ